MPEYPGLGLALRHNPQSDYGFYPIGAHGSCYGSDSELLPVRELAMMSIMDRLTDKPDWHKKVFNDEIVSKWRKEALAIPDAEFWKLSVSGKWQYWENGRVMVRDAFGQEEKNPLNGIVSHDTFDFCINELQSKARYYEKSGIIPTLDACASVAKSDTLVSLELRDSILKAFDKLKADQSSSPDWHPNSNNMVLDLVHPSMYPLVYGRSRVLKEELVGVSDAIEKWAGKGEIIPKDDWEWNEERDRFRYNVGSGEVPPQFWSDTYQWLPANVVFQENGAIKFTSYINNLHPTKYPDIYRTIEELIETTLPIWDQCLTLASDYEKREGPGRIDSRFPRPEYPDDENPDNWIPLDAKEIANAEVSVEDMAEEGYEPECYLDEDASESDKARYEAEYKWKVLRKPRIPEPPKYEEIDYLPAEGKRLVDKFRDSGLQIIVKMASIELTPDKPEFPAGGWHIEGQMNEHICATALYYLDSENISPSSLSFRMQTSAYMEEEYSVGQDAYHWMEDIYGTGLGGRSDPCLQNYGSVETQQGRLLAFPNVLQHRVSSFRLEDPSKPGHRRFIALWLVDPHRRIISTANVPPQQQDWWLESVFGSSTESRNSAMSKLPAELVALLHEKGLSSSVDSAENGRLPPELMEMVREHFNADEHILPMRLEEAKEHREKLMQVRSAFHRKAEDGWRQHSYSFCEH